MNGLLEEARRYAALGWKVFPVYEMAGEACACAKGAECDRPGKHPRVSAWDAEASSDRNQVELWWTRWPQANIGIATGRKSGLTVVDADASGGKPGVINLTKLCAPHGGVPSTAIVETGGGGLHLYFKYTEALSTGKDVLGKAIDVRNDGGYVVAPPSNHASGGRYKWRSAEGNLLDCPEFLLSRSASTEEEPRRRRGRPRTQPGFPLDKLESMLRALDSSDRDLWLQVGVIMGRLYVGTGLEADGWAVYEAWSAHSELFDRNRAENLARMREMFYEYSQSPPRTGGAPLSIGTIIAKAKEAGWSPFGDRKVIAWSPGDEGAMATALAEALAEREDNTLFEVMGEVVDVQRVRIPIMRIIKHAEARGLPPPEGVIVRRTATPTLLAELSRVAALETADKHGVPQVMPIPERLGSMILSNNANDFRTLSGIARWPMVAEDGELIFRPRGYDKSSGLYFCIDPSVRIEEVEPDAALRWLREELLRDFPFEESTDFAAALGMLLAFMQRPLMKYCPGFAVVAPQPGTGKTTLVELASLAVHGDPIAVHPMPKHDEEFRKAIHSMLLAKMPAVLFDNIGRGELIDSDQLAKILTAEVAADRTLGSSVTRKQVNTLLIAFTGNNIALGDDLTSRALTVRLNARSASPFNRSFRHRNIKDWILGERNRTLSALVALARAGAGFAWPEPGGSRYEDFDVLVAKAVMVATGCDLRALMVESAEQESDETAEDRSALELLARWQDGWRKAENGRPWRARDLIAAVDENLFEEQSLNTIKRAVGLAAWEASPANALGKWLRAMNGDHRFTPMVLTSRADPKHKVSVWRIKGTGANRREGDDAHGF